MNLQFYLKQDIQNKRVQRVLEFKQERWMELIIRMNTELRKYAKSDFKNSFYKLINNFRFGKTTENLRNHADINIVRSNKTNKIRQLDVNPSYLRHGIFANDMVGIDMHKSKLILNKTVYIGTTIPGNSKFLMEDFFYNELTKIRPKVQAVVHRHG